MKANCGCNECDFKNLINKGCTKALQRPFVCLDHKTLTQNEKDVLLLKLKEDADTIDQNYTDMLHQFDAWMKDNISIEVYRNILCKIPGTLKKDVPLLKDKGKEIKTADHYDCSILLSDYYTWFNCSVLTEVLTTAKKLTNKDPDKVLSSLQSYTEEMLKYCRRSIFACPQPLDMSPTQGKTYFTLKLISDKLPDEKQFTADKIQHFTARIMTLFEIKEYVLQLCSFADGCVELVYSIPLCIYAEIFPLNEEQCKDLTTLGVSEITTKDYHYKLYHVSSTKLQTDMYWVCM